MIIYKTDALGGFVVGDTSTRHTAYALPSSPYACEARMSPGRVARCMMASANAFAVVISPRVVVEQNNRNWARLRAVDSVVISLVAGY